MITFDWPKFLAHHSITYVTRGPNIGRGEIGIRCPWCGSDDPSQHMAINLEGAGWYCRRNPAQHSGKSPIRLIQALTRCDYREAAALAGVTALPSSGLQPFDEQIRQLLAPPPGRAPAPLPALAMPKEFISLKQARNFTSGRAYQAYLEGRGFELKHAERLMFEYDLHFCVTGPFAGRIIIPVYLQPGLLATWTGRAIEKGAVVRYKTLTTDPKKAEDEGTPLARLPITNTLWNLHQASGHTLVMCEGPFDAINVDVRGADKGIRATCLFGKRLSGSQTALLYAAKDRFERRLLLLDRDAGPDAMAMASALAFIGFELRFLPPGVKDPGELTSQQVAAL